MSPRGGATATAVCAVALALTGCSGIQSSTDPHGPVAGAIYGLFIVFMIVAAIVQGGVTIALLLGALRRRRLDARSVLELDPASERRATLVVSALVGLTAATIAGLTLLSFFVGRTDARLAGSQELVVRVTAHQWWWEFTFEDPAPDRQLTTANELHIPVGRPVRLKLLSPDVIHSFWVPALSGKKDLIPGRLNEILVQADKAGVFRGQCAEYCGLQHANMALKIVAEPPAQFDRWFAAQLTPAAEPRGAQATRGREVFLSSGCALCHRIRGTSAAAVFGPDLTHLASRSMLAAGAAPMTPGGLGGWIADPQTVKPGSKMPRVPLSGPELVALVAYLEELK
ncbi:cytochrome c oxidase subunit II [Hansschlegelia sp.]|uniref:cytochrome c oxidase subunit II n=1 Tax=Hansschlegelia sp. TaxID=2041892 RepID=UPI002B77695A|nr:cytochrome c oxidase subunit II [Hansschlegelia sp.]HVI28660.1 cytochrome c oxidase subunit II [Hansschlegelia sp.]